MRRLWNIATLLVALVAFAAVGHAQATLTYTTLAAAVTGGSGQGSYSGVAGPLQTAVALTSVTGVSAPSQGAIQTILYVDDEAMAVMSVNTTTKVATVQRGFNGTPANPHANGAPVILGPPSDFYSADPSGACTASATVVTPWVNIVNGRQWVCDSTTGVWLPVLTTGSITPSATTSSIQTAGQTFTVNGIVSGEPLAVLVQPAPTSLCPLVAVRATAANTVTLYWTVLTAAACTPASGVYYLFDPLRTDAQ